ncbi:MAG: hypothetical protein DDT34_02433 [Firmicutes bacterium]|nr:hypothetical protein [Bacillota bacterium]
MFDIKVVDPADKPYPVADVDFVTFLLLDAKGQLVYVGEAKAVADGLWRAVLTPEMTKKLVVGPSRLEVAVAPLVVTVPTLASIGFVALPVEEIEGDVDGDGKVDATDLAAVAAALNTKEGDDNWNPAADLNQDGIVDIFDLVRVGRNFGKDSK